MPEERKNNRIAKLKLSEGTATNKQGESFDYSIYTGYLWANTAIGIIKEYDGEKAQTDNGRTAIPVILLDFATLPDQKYDTEYDKSLVIGTYEPLEEQHDIKLSDDIII